MRVRPLIRRVPSPSSSRRATRRRGCRASRSPTSPASRWSCASPSARRQSGAARVVVATDDERIVDAVARTASTWCMTRADHPTGTDRLAEAAAQLGLADDDDRRQRAGRRAAARAGADPRGWPSCSPRIPTRRSRPRAIRSTMPRRRSIRTSSRSCSTRAATRSTSAARRFRGRATRSRGDARALPAGLPLYRHYGLYAYRVAFLRAYPDACAGADRALRGARAAARAVARLPDRRRDHRRHAGAGRRHAGGSRARARAVRSRRR